MRKEELHCKEDAGFAGGRLDARKKGEEAVEELRRRGHEEKILAKQTKILMSTNLMIKWTLQSYHTYERAFFQPR